MIRLKIIIIPEKKINLSTGAYNVLQAIVNLPNTSNMLIYAKTDIFSCEIIAALYGTVIRLRMKDIIEN